MNYRLQLLILAQALDDILENELGGELEEEHLDSAEAYVADYPKLLQRVWAGEDLERWQLEIERARDDLAAALKVRRSEKVFHSKSEMKRIKCQKGEIK